MKLLIDIPEIEYNTRKIMGYFSDNFKILKAVANGTPISDNATNGDVIKALFPNEHDFETDFDEYWWNAPYQKDGKE